MPAARRLAARDVPAIAAIARGLPDYFTDDVAGQVEADSVNHDSLVLADVGEITGFAVVEVRMLDRPAGYLPYGPRALDNSLHTGLLNFLWPLRPLGSHTEAGPSGDGQ